MTFATSPIVNCGGFSSAGRDLIRRSTLRFALSLSGCSTNCRLKYSAHLFGSVTVTSLKVTEVLSSFFPGFESDLTVTHSLLISVPMLQHFRWSSHFFLLCSCTNRLTSTVKSLILGSVGLVRRRSSRSFANPAASAGKFGLISGIRPAGI